MSSVTEGQIALDDFTNINQESYTVTLSNQGANMYNYTLLAHIRCILRMAPWRHLFHISYLPVAFSAILPSCHNLS